MSNSEVALEQARVAMTEFQALRTEIGGRSTAQYTLVGINLVATSTLGGIALSKDNSTPNVLLLIAPVCVATGLLWLDHAHAIYQIGDYIKRTLWAFLRERLVAANAPPELDLPSYEKYAIAGKSLVVERSIFLLPFMLVFVAPPIVAAFYVLNHAHQGWVSVALGFDMVLDAALVGAWVLALRQFWRRDPGIDSTGPSNVSAGTTT